MTLPNATIIWCDLYYHTRTKRWFKGGSYGSKRIIEVDTIHLPDSRKKIYYRKYCLTKEEYRNRQIDKIILK